jgi:hypothetical protein
MDEGRVLEPALPSQPKVSSKYTAGNEPGKGLSKQKGASDKPSGGTENVIPMGKKMANDPGMGLGKTNSGSY